MLNKTYLVDENPGSLSNIYEIKILICLILNQLQIQITKDHLNVALQLNETVNYFNFCQALQELMSAKQVMEKNRPNDKKNKYLYLTDTGLEIANNFKNNIPKTLIQKNINTIIKIIQEERENKNTQIYINKNDDGYSVKLTLEEIQSNLMELELFCPNLKTAKNMKSQIKLKTTELYKTILALINDDYDTISQIIIKLKNQNNKKTNTFSVYEI